MPKPVGESIESDGPSYSQSYSGSGSFDSCSGSSYSSVEEYDNLTPKSSTIQNNVVPEASKGSSASAPAPAPATSFFGFIQGALNNLVPGAVKAEGEKEPVSVEAVESLGSNMSYTVSYSSSDDEGLSLQDSTVVTQKHENEEEEKESAFVRGRRTQKTEADLATERQNMFQTAPTRTYSAEKDTKDRYAPAATKRTPTVSNEVAIDLDSLSLDSRPASTLESRLGINNSSSIDLDATLDNAVENFRSLDSEVDLNSVDDDTEDSGIDPQDTLDTDVDLDSTFDTIDTMDSEDNLGSTDHSHESEVDVGSTDKANEGETVLSNSLSEQKVSTIHTADGAGEEEDFSSRAGSSDSASRGSKTSSVHEIESDSVGNVSVKLRAISGDSYGEEEQQHGIEIAIDLPEVDPSPQETDVGNEDFKENSKDDTKEVLINYSVSEDSGLMFSMPSGKDVDQLGDDESSASISEHSKYCTSSETDMSNADRSMAAANSSSPVLPETGEAIEEKSSKVDGNIERIHRLQVEAIMQDEEDEEFDFGNKAEESAGSKDNGSTEVSIEKNEANSNLQQDETSVKSERETLIAKLKAASLEKAKEKASLAEENTVIDTEEAKNLDEEDVFAKSVGRETFTDLDTQEAETTIPRGDGVEGLVNVQLTHSINDEDKNEKEGENYTGSEQAKIVEDKHGTETGDLTDVEAEEEIKYTDEDQEEVVDVEDKHGTETGDLTDVELEEAGAYKDEEQEKVINIDMDDAETLSKPVINTEDDDTEEAQDEKSEENEFSLIEKEVRSSAMEAEMAAVAAVAAVNAKLTVEKIIHQSEEEARARAEARVEAQRLRAEAQSEALRVRLEGAERGRLEKEAEALKLANEEEARICADEGALRRKAEEEAKAYSEKDVLEETKIADANEKVQQMFNNFTIVDDAHSEKIKGRVVIDDELKRHRSTLISKSTTSAWWTNPDSIRKKRDASEGETALLRKGTWFYEQLQQAEAIVDSTNCIKNNNEYKKSTELIGETKIWWDPRGRTKKTPTRVNSARTRRWFFDAHEQENEIDITTLAVTNEEETGFFQSQKRKVTNISGRNWLVESDKEEISEETEEKIVGEEQQVDKENKQPTESIEADAATIASNGISIDSNMSVLKQRISGTIRALDIGRSSSENSVSFKNPAPIVVPREPLQNGDEILKKHTKRRKALDFKQVELTPQIKDLIEGLKSDSIPRRSNACGTLKLMASQKKNTTMLGKTSGLIDALLFVAKETPGGADAEKDAILTSRHRALTTIALLCQPKENRRGLCENEQLITHLVETIKNGDGEARLHSCSSIAALAKTEENRDILAEQDLIEELAELLTSLREKPHESKGERMEVVGVPQSKTTTSQKIPASTRLNACAALLHLSKQCVVSVRLWDSFISFRESLSCD